MSELLPCPFCGFDAISVEDDGHGNCVICCTSCEAEPSIVLPSGEMDAARTTWNVRAAPIPALLRAWAELPGFAGMVFGPGTEIIHGCSAAFLLRRCADALESHEEEE